jgi:hypothetical protein
MSGHPLPEYTIDLLRQIKPEVPRNVGYTWWIYEPAPYVRGTWFEGVRVLHKPSDVEGVIVGTRLMNGGTILVQVRWDGKEYAPGRCDFVPEWDLEAIGQGEPLPVVRVGQLSLLDESDAA